jgi:hypothetical protein
MDHITSSTFAGAAQRAAIRQSKRGPSTALRTREKRGKDKDARNFAQMV